MFKKNIWYENLYQKAGQYFFIDEILYNDNNNFQNLLIFKNNLFGKIMSLNGIIQTTESDEFIYHEMITHIPLISHGNAKKVLIIGGGDGGVLREVSLHINVEKITMVEIDKNVINICKKYLPKHSSGAFNDKRLNLIIKDGLDFVNQNNNKFDVIISDCTDPIGPGVNLFTSNFYKGCSKILDKNGIFISQNGVNFLQKDEVIKNYKKIKNYFNNVYLYTASVPTYYGGLMTFIFASNNIKLKKFDGNIISNYINKFKLSFNYYNVKMHINSFVLPQYLLNNL